MEWRAKLRKPRSELWLGAVVTSVEECVSKASGYPYVKLRFLNCPFVGIFGLFDGRNLYKLALEHGMRVDPTFRVGDVLTLDVRWRLTPAFDKEVRPSLPEFVPDVKVELRSLLESRGVYIYYEDRPVAEVVRSWWQRLRAYFSESVGRMF